jgi:hypothetical protein
MLTAAILGAILVAALASVRVEECEIIPGAFSNAFSSGFDVSRKVCGQTTMAHVAVAKMANTAARVWVETRQLLAR